MQIYELRKTASNNKKYKYIYQVVVKGKVIARRNSSVNYRGCLVSELSKGDFLTHHYFKDAPPPLGKFPTLVGMAMPFDTLAGNCDTGAVIVSAFFPTIHPAK